MQHGLENQVLNNLVKSWRQQATELYRRVRAGDYSDQTQRCLMSCEAKTLRKSAKNLYHALRRFKNV